MIFHKQIEKIYRSNLFVRNDNANGIFYFGPEDFPGLQAHPFTFSSKAGHSLKGYFYHYEDPVPGRLMAWETATGPICGRSSGWRKKVFWSFLMTTPDVWNPAAKAPTDSDRA